MKKALLSIVAIATLAFTGASFASYTGNAVDYYNTNKSEWTLHVGSLGYTSIGSLIIYNHATLGRVSEYVEQSVICKNGGMMCYASETAMTAFGIDVYAFTRGQEEVTNKKVDFVNLYKKLYVEPLFK